MIVAIGSDKGAPGATTLTAVLGLVWPSNRVVVELDPRGADLPFRLMLAGGQPMATVPSIAALAVDARPGGAAPQLERYAQPTALGVPVIPGELSSRANGRVMNYLTAITDTAAAWTGTAIADVGSLHHTNPAMPLTRSAEAVLLVTRPTVEGLGHLRDRIDELTEYVGDPRRPGGTVGVVLATEAGNAKAAMEQTAKLLGSIGSPATVLGILAHDPGGARALWGGPPTKKLLRSPLVRSARDLAARVIERWPALAAADGAPALAGRP